MTPEVESALKILGFAATIVFGVITLGWNIYHAVVGQQKALSDIREAAATAKADVQAAVTASKDEARHDLETARDAFRSDIKAASASTNERIEQLRTDLRDSIRRVEDERLEMRERVASIETKVKPYWRFVETNIFPLMKGVLPDEPNPVTKEQMAGLVHYRTDPDNTPIEEVYLARDAAEIEIHENKDLDPTAIWFYTVLWGAANDRITDYEAEQRRLKNSANHS